MIFIHLLPNRPLIQCNNGISGSGQKLLARLLNEHPFVTVKQPSNYIRHVALFSEAWFEEESLETNRLNEGGISKEVLLDTFQVRK